MAGLAQISISEVGSNGNIKDGTAFKVSETSTETYNGSIKSSIKAITAVPLTYE